MNAHLKIVVGAGAAILIGAALVLALRKGEPAAPPAPAPAAVVDAAPAPAAPTPPPADATPAPWETGPAMRTAAAPATAAMRVPPPPTSPDAQMRTAIAQMERQMAQNEAQAHAMLRQLNTAQATGSLPPGMNVEAARTNIQIALKAQQLGREMVALSQQPDSPARQQRMNQISTELIALREGLRYDVNTPAAAKAAP